MKRFISSSLFLVLLFTAACAPLDLRIPATGPEPTLVPTIFIPTRTPTPVVVANPTANATGTAAAVTTSIVAANATATALASTSPLAAVTATPIPTATQPALPTVEVTFPSNGVKVNPGQQVIIRAVITAPVGIERIELWADGALVQKVPNQDPSLTTLTAVLPYSTQAAGTHSLTILAYDVLNQVGAGGPYRVDVAAAPVPQSGFTNPGGEQTTIAAGENLTLNYWASSSIGISRAELWVDGRLAFSDTADGAARAVFQHVWSSDAVGDHTFFIRV